MKRVETRRSPLRRLRRHGCRLSAEVLISQKAFWFPNISARGVLQSPQTPGNSVSATGPCIRISAKGSCKRILLGGLGA